MSWSETTFILQHFYNIFDVDQRLITLEGKSPIVAKMINGEPEGIIVNNLSIGTLWFIKDNSSPNMISGLSILIKGVDETKIFTNPIPLTIDLNNISLDDDLLEIVGRMNLTSQNFYDIIKIMLEILETVPVSRGGTGKTSITKNAVLVGDTGNTFKEINFDATPTARSDNLISSGVLFEVLKLMAEKNHASSSKDYGVGTNQNFGHLKITDDYTIKGDDIGSTAVSVKAIGKLLDQIETYLNLFQVIDENAKKVTDPTTPNATLYSGCISAYKTVGMREDTLQLINSYFSVEPNTTGNHTLII